MSIYLTDDIEVKTKKGKLGAAKQIFLEGDMQTVEKEIQDINSRHNTLNTKHESLSKTVQGIATTGGASTATNVTYDNTNSGMTAENIQDAVDKLAKEKANSADVNIELDKKFNKENIAQELGDSKDKVVSQFALPFREIESPEFIKVIVDANDHPLFTINLDGEVDWAKGIPAPIRAKLQEIINQCQQDKTDLLESINTLKGILDKITIKDEEGIVFETPFRYIQNEEFIFAKVDAEDRLLFGIEWDGTPRFDKTSAVEDRLQEQVTLLSEKVTTIMGDEDTTNVIDTMNELKKFFAEIENTETLTGILDNLGNVAKNLDKTTIKDEAGEIQDTPFRVISNEEFLWAVVDSEERVLFGIYRATGKLYYPLNEMYHVIQNEEFFAAWLTTDNKVVLGIRRDGEIIGEIHAVNVLKQVISQLQADLASLQEKVGTIDTNLKELLNIFSFQENPEYLAVEKDTDGKVLSATNSDGSHYAYNLKSETIDAKVDKEKGKSLIDSDVSDSLSIFEDIEGRTEITKDVNGKVISERKENGEKYESAMDIDYLKIRNLNLQGKSIDNIQDALKAKGFDMKTNFSNYSFIQIPKPRFAMVNITGVSMMPINKTQNLHSYIEFWDMQGNYFKKRAILNAQGNSSMIFVKKNAAIDICDDEWVGDKTAKIRFGDWVPQDSFHLKAYYTDFFRGVGVVSYELYEQIVKTRGNMCDKPWKKALVNMSSIGVTTNSLGNYLVGQIDLQTDTGALCHPDGFPVALYLNGEFYGIFSWQLKKHRDNYHMNKSTAEHIHLDGTLGPETFFGGKNKINWSEFEIRNPKGLYAIGGNKYDADIRQEEIAGSSEINSWIVNGKLPDKTPITPKIKKALQMTANVKTYLQNFAEVIPLLNKARDTYEASEKSEQDLKTLKDLFETYFDVENLVDYQIISDIIYNVDGFKKNWQWTSYDGKKWWVNLYDTDQSFGAYFQGDRTVEPPTEHMEGNSFNIPSGYICNYYTSELNKRYKELANMGIISANYIFKILRDWTMCIGTDFYKKEYSKWADSPCNSNSIVRSEYWELVTDAKGNIKTDVSESFNATHVYNIGDEVSFGIDSTMGYYKFKCIKQTEALPTNTPHTVSSYSPIQEFRHSDNLYRAQKWIEKNVENMDKIYNYTRI